MSIYQPRIMRKDSVGYSQNNHSVGLATVHLVWIPKRRKPVLKGDIRTKLSEILESILESVAVDNGWIIKAKEIASDQVHLLVEYDENTAICDVVRAFKGHSSKLLRDEFPDLKKTSFVMD
jgi:putative transposase